MTLADDFQVLANTYQAAVNDYTLKCAATVTAAANVTGANNALETALQGTDNQAIIAAAAAVTQAQDAYTAAMAAQEQSRQSLQAASDAIQAWIAANTPNPNPGRPYHWSTVMTQRLTEMDRVLTAWEGLKPLLANLLHKGGD